MQDGAFTETVIGSAQGEVISPLISNIYLNYFDQKMKAKGIRIVRYANDILIFAKDKQTAGNYRAVATKILEKDKVNKHLWRCRVLRFCDIWELDSGPR